MPSERVQRRIDRLLDQIDAAEAGGDWRSVRHLSSDVLDIDPDNVEATAYLRAAKRRLPSERSATAEPESRPKSLQDGAVRHPDGAALAAPETPTSFVNGRYEVSRLLGEGGKKKVYLAHDTTLDRDVAFALIKTEGLDDEARQRVTREAQAMARLGDNPNIMPIFDLGEEDGQPYLVQPVMGAAMLKR